MSRRSQKDIGITAVNLGIRLRKEDLDALDAIAVADLRSRSDTIALLAREETARRTERLKARGGGK